MTPSRTTLDLYQAANEVFHTLGKPRGVLDEVNRECFREVYRGAGLNPVETPLDGIFPQAHRLALFVVTMGPLVDAEIRRLLEHRELALAFMLDSVASAAADRAADEMAQHYHQLLISTGRVPPLTRVLPYSPGYCGWHVSGQRALFDRLGPDEVGVELSESCLMRPLKSVSGVLVAAEPEAHTFVNAFSFCGDCVDHQCRERIAHVVQHSGALPMNLEDAYEGTG